jgi:hypothetical protein
MLPAYCTTAATRAWTILAACAVACVVEPDHLLLTGLYGGDGIGLVATATEARFEFRCAYGHTGPLRLGWDGIARASGTLQAYGAPWRSRDLDVEARLRESVVLELTIRIGEGSSVSYVALLDTPPDVAAYCLDAGAS